MSDDHGLPEGWQTVKSPPALFRRFEFADYAQTREFLDKLAELSEETGLHPDLSFGKTYANVTIAIADGTPGVSERDFATRVNNAIGASA